MRIRFSGNDLSRVKSDLAACFAYESDDKPLGIADARLRSELSRQMKAEDFEGRTGDRMVWNADVRYRSRRFLVMGLGSRLKAPGESTRLGCARAARAAAQFSARSLALALTETNGTGAADEARAAIEGAIMGAYQFDRYLTESSRRSVKLDWIELAAAGPGLRQAVNRAEIGARAVCLARDLVNEGPSRLTPTVMARVASKEARARGLGCKVLGPPELRKIGMSALLAVSRGSREIPRVVHLTYKPSARTKKRVLLVGKGVTFDSGGLNLKLGDSMLTMKSDMAGAAAVLALQSGNADWKIDRHRHRLSPDRQTSLTHETFQIYCGQNAPQCAWARHR